MDNLTKHKLKLLAESYGWYISYEKHIMQLQRGGDRICFDRSNDLLTAEYPEGDGVVLLALEPDLIFDLFFDLMWYPDSVPRYRPKKSETPLNLDSWAEAWGHKGVEDVIVKLLRDIHQGRGLNRDFGGNLVLAEYAHGLIILSHDLLWSPTNVITLAEAKAFHGLV
jgi:hypothetical protein